MANAPISSRAGTSALANRKQQLVFIGQNLDEAWMRARLDACLLDSEIADQDSRAWVGMTNPFPTLRLAEAE